MKLSPAMCVLLCILIAAFVALSSATPPEPATPTPTLPLCHRTPVVQPRFAPKAFGKKT